MTRLVPLILAAALLAGCGSPETRASRAEGEPRPAPTRAPTPVADAAAPHAARAAAPVSATAASDAPASDPAPDAPVGPRSPDAAAATAAAAPTATAPDAAAVLRRAEKAFAGVRSMRADFVQDLSVPLLSQSQRSRGTIYHRRPDRFLMKFSDPAGDVVVADGTYLWTYYPSSQPDQVVRASLAAAGQQVDFEREFLERPVERFNSTLDGEATVAGRSAYVLTLVPKEPAGYRKVRIWVDRDDALVRRFEVTEQNESVRRIELRDLAVNVPLGDDLFRFTPPAGAQVFTQ